MDQRVGGAKWGGRSKVNKIRYTFRRDTIIVIHIRVMPKYTVQYVFTFYR